MPWWSNGNAMDSRVVSWPPCSDDVEVKTPAGLPLNVPDSHSVIVLSKKYLSDAVMLPKWVGLPSTRPEHSSRSERST